jgi:hypothetical protein
VIGQQLILRREVGLSTTELLGYVHIDGFLSVEVS